MIFYTAKAGHSSSVHSVYESKKKRKLEKLYDKKLFLTCAGSKTSTRRNVSQRLFGKFF